MAMIMKNRKPYGGGPVLEDKVETGNMNAVTSNAVSGALDEYGKSQGYNRSIKASNHYKGDLNDIRSFSTYYVTKETVTNYPEDCTSIYGFVTTYPFYGGNNWASQIFYSMGTTEVFFRTLNNNTWSDWKALGAATEESGINLARLCKGDGRNLLTVLGVDTVAEAGAALKAKSDAKDYTGLMLGDYLDITSDYEGTSKTVRYEIVAFNHYYIFYNATSDNIEYDLGNITFLAKTVVYEKRINPTYSSTSERQYSNSELRGILNGSVYNSLKTALGVEFKHIIQYQQFNNGTYDSPDWCEDYDYDGEESTSKEAEFVYLPSSREIIGEKGWGCEYWDNSHQFTALALDSSKIPAKYNGSSYWFWNRTPSQSPGGFCNVSHYGRADYSYANNTYGGVRPAFNL